MKLELLEKIFFIQSQVQLAHWQETSGYRHQVLGDYYKESSELFDFLVETYIGSIGEIQIQDSLYKIHNQVDLQMLFIDITNILQEFKMSFNHDQPKIELINIIEDLLSLTYKTKGLLKKS